MIGGVDLSRGIRASKRGKYSKKNKKESCKSKNRKPEEGHEGSMNLLQETEQRAGTCNEKKTREPSLEDTAPNKQL
jgi:phosphatidylserine/phosphatidylglycerophosphate/cardiolipin synthase-like enzyme